MKILLVYPPLALAASDIMPLQPPLGLAYIAAVLEENNYEVKILDAYAQGIDNIETLEDGIIRVGLSPLDIRRYITEYQPDVVGVNASFSALAQNSHDIAAMVKEINPGTLVVFGGAHASAVPELVLSDSNIDIVVKGEGEITFLELVKYFSENESISDIPGTVIRKDNGIFANPARPYIEDLNTLPFPARHLLPMKVYSQQPAFMYEYCMRPPRATMISSRGCPMKCVFCSIHTIWGHTWRSRAADKVVDEMEMLVKDYGVREIAFLDDNLTLNRARILEICKEIIRRKLDVRWCTPNGVAIWTLNEEVLRQMKASGCWEVRFGIESGCPETQKFIGKKINLERANRLFKMAGDIGLWTGAYFVLGFPDESIESINQTIDFALSSELDLATFFVATPIPGTRLYEIMAEKGLIPEGTTYWSTTKPNWGTMSLTTRELQQIVVHARTRFQSSRIRRYMNPFRLSKKMRSVEELWYLLKIARGVLGAQFKVRKTGRLQPYLK